MSRRFLTEPTSLLASSSSSPTCVPSRSGLSPTSLMTVIDDEIDDNLEDVNMPQYPEEDLFIIQTSYDPQLNIAYRPGRKGPNESDFDFKQRNFAYTEYERGRAERAIVPKNSLDLAKKVCRFLNLYTVLNFFLQLKAQVISGKRRNLDVYIRITPKVLDG